MDAIKNLVSGVDPVGKDSDVPDGEMVLREVLSQQEVFVGRMPANLPNLAERRQRRRKVAGVLAVAAAAVTTGVLLTLNLGPLANGPAPATTSTATAPASAATATAGTPGLVPTAAPEPSAAAEAASKPAAAAWQRYLSADGKISFDYPLEWKVVPKPDNPEYPALNLDVEDSNGKRIASLHYGAMGGIGGACAGSVPYQVLDSVELPLPYNPSAPNVIAPRFAFRVLLEADKVIASYGLTSTTAGADGRSCMFYNVVNGSPESPLYSFADVVQVSIHDSPAADAKTFGSLDEARAYMLTPEYTNARRMIMSLQIHSAQ